MKYVTGTLTISAANDSRSMVGDHLDHVGMKKRTRWSSEREDLQELLLDEVMLRNGCNDGELRRMKEARDQEDDGGVGDSGNGLGRRAAASVLADEDGTPLPWIREPSPDQLLAGDVPLLGSSLEPVQRSSHDTRARTPRSVKLHRHWGHGSSSATQPSPSPGSRSTRTSRRSRLHSGTKSPSTLQGHSDQGEGTGNPEQDQEPDEQADRTQGDGGRRHRQRGSSEWSRASVLCQSSTLFYLTPEALLNPGIQEFLSTLSSR